MSKKFFLSVLTINGGLLLPTSLFDSHVSLINFIRKHLILSLQLFFQLNTESFFNPFFTKFCCQSNTQINFMQKGPPIFLVFRSVQTFWHAADLQPVLRAPSGIIKYFRCDFDPATNTEYCKFFLHVIIYNAFKTRYFQNTSRVVRSQYHFSQAESCFVYCLQHTLYPPNVSQTDVLQTCFYLLEKKIKINIYGARIYKR